MLIINHAIITAYEPGRRGTTYNLVTHQMGCSEICHKLIVWLPVALDLPRLWLSIYGPSIKAYQGNTLLSWTDLCVIINVNFMVRLQFELKITTRLKPWIFEINWCSQTKPICIWYLVIHTNCTNLVWEKSYRIISL